MREIDSLLIAASEKLFPETIIRAIRTEKGITLYVADDHGQSPIHPPYILSESGDISMMEPSAARGSSRFRASQVVYEDKALLESIGEPERTDEELPLRSTRKKGPMTRGQFAQRLLSLLAGNSLDIAGLGGTISPEDTSNLDGGKGSGPPLGNQNAAGPHKGAGQSKGRFVSYKERRKIEARLNGQVSSQGTTVKRVSDHAFDRVGGRMISVGRIEKMLQSNNVSRDKDYADRKVYDIPGSRLVLSDDGTIVTVMWRKKNK